jgi:hypothetical protein
MLFASLPQRGRLEQAVEDLAARDYGHEPVVCPVPERERYSGLGAMPHNLKPATIGKRNLKRRRLVCAHSFKAIRPMERASTNANSPP